MTFQLLNDQNMFAAFEFTEIMTIPAWDLLKKAVKKHANELSEKECSSWENVWSIVAQLPHYDCRVTGFVGDFKDSKNIHAKRDHDRHPRGYGLEKCTVIVNPKRFVSRAQNNDNIPIDFQKWGLDCAIELGQYSRMIEKFIATYDLPITYIANTSKRAIDVKRRLAAGEYKMEAYDRIGNLAEVEACVVFVVGHNGKSGYLNSKGGWGPLGGARLFESSGAAYTTIRAKKISSAAVVHIGTQVLRVDEKCSLEKGFENLQEAMSIVERKRIENALNQATQDQLVQRLAQFEDHKDDSLAVRKKRM